MQDTASREHMMPGKIEEFIFETQEGVMIATGGTDRTTQIIQQHGEDVWIPLDDLKIDHTYQRPLDPYRAQRMAANYDPQLIGRLTINVRENGETYVVDGQHRLELLRLMHAKVAPCTRHLRWSIQREAEIFRRLNTEHKLPTPWQLHQSAVVAGNDTAIAVDNILYEFGLKFVERGGPPSKGGIRAVARVYDLYTGRYGGPQMLRAVLSTVVTAWGIEDPRAFDQFILSGVQTFIYRASRDENFDIKRLVKVMSRTTPAAVFQGAKAFSEMSRYPRASGVVFALLNLYQSNLRVNRLTVFDSLQALTVGDAGEAVRGSIAEPVVADEEPFTPR